ncbi:hypothetical protein [Pseudonocardia abyssalis]|uniref:Right handed beta helix domain-containing protein n=1 Tax=Pseudonocardia abyssalis TaxID=2792008 RepID=A0ABS6USV9_9PSEU|nr:hypothetical protein [Pseudonocardia abyssalis]MBW0115359.1 hypothetical protein [Pseudonocardia abyssalis]MBW0135338.1 hypothetical protein [Pseudonocardia abyssalis]
MSVPGTGRVGLTLVAFAVGVSGVVLATEGVTFGAPAPTVALAPVVSTGCAAAGPYVVPERGSVGLPPSLRLCAAGPLTITRPGTVLDGMDVRGGVVVDAPDVVVRRSRITGDGTRAYGIVTTGAGSVRIEDTTLTGRFTEAAVGGDRWTAERIEVVGVTGDGAHAGRGSRLRASVLSRFAPGREVTGLTVTASDVVVEDSTIRMGDGHLSAVRIASDGGGRPIVVRSNVLGGGGYTVHQDEGPGDDVHVVDNRFARDAVRAPLRVPMTAEATGNTYVDGAPVR